MSQVTLGELLVALEALPREHVLRLGLHTPGSYRGFYEHVYFSPTDDITVGEVLSEVRAAIGADFEGYKGGFYTMYNVTPVWVASYGGLGWPLTRELLGVILDEHADCTECIREGFDECTRGDPRGEWGPNGAQE